MTHVDLVDRLAAVVEQQRVSRILVAIDGPDAAGKTTLADRLAEAVHLPTVRVSVDSYLRPPDERYRQGELSPQGYYDDSVDEADLLVGCLGPFRAGESLVLRGAEQRDVDVEGRRAAVASQAVLVVDGVFLLRERLRHLWDVTIYPRVSPQECLRRARHRDADILGSEVEVDRRYSSRTCRDKSSTVAVPTRSHGRTSWSTTRFRRVLSSSGGAPRQTVRAGERTSPRRRARCRVACGWCVREQQAGTR